MIDRAADDGVNVAALHHIPEILVACGLGPEFLCQGEMGVVDVADGDDVAERRSLPGDTATATAAPDQRQRGPFVGGSRDVLGFSRFSFFREPSGKGRGGCRGRSRF